MTEVKFRSDVTVELIDSLGDENSIVRAARVSTQGAKAEATEAAGLIRFLMREGHYSPLEHAVLSFRFEVPKAIQVQMRTHRTLSWNVESGRYREWKPVFFIPHSDRPVRQEGKVGDYTFVQDDVAIAEARHHLECGSIDAWLRYRQMIDAGVAREVARYVLPDNAYTSSVATGNLRAWLTFVSLRTYESGSHPQEEIADVAYQVADVLAEKFPTVWYAFIQSGYKKL